jgi:hypothetical protein
VGKISILIIGICIGLLLGVTIFLFSDNYRIQDEETLFPEHAIQVDTVYRTEKKTSLPQKITEKSSKTLNDENGHDSTLLPRVDSSDYVVLRDRLLHTQRVHILKNSTLSPSGAADKLVERMSTDDYFNDEILVEFWESPIDYQGYRLNKTKLILYGINPNESFMLSLISPGVLNMQTGDFNVLLYPTEKYRSFIFQ